MIASDFLPPPGFFKYVACLRKVITRREIFAPFNCYLDILLALRNYSWISGLPLIEATNLWREGGRVPTQPAQQAHTLIKLTNIVHLYHYDSLYIHQLGGHVSVKHNPEKNITNLL